MTDADGVPAAADRRRSAALTPAELRAIQRRYAVQLGALNQIQIHRLAAAAIHDVPRLLAALQQLQAERDTA